MLHNPIVAPSPNLALGPPQNAWAHNPGLIKKKKKTKDGLDDLICILTEKTMEPTVALHVSQPRIITDMIEGIIFLKKWYLELAHEFMGSVGRHDNVTGSWCYETFIYSVVYE